MDKVFASTNLHDLCAALNALSHDERNDNDLSDLPVFGPADPVVNTNNVWSWDADDAIVQTFAGFKVVPRAAI